jgi:fluoride exporter
MAALWVFIGGGIGSVIRYLFGLLFSKTNLLLPYATLCSNVSSCLIFASALLFLYGKTDVSPNVKLFLLTGICGGLSTFSTFSFETFELFRQQQFAWAMVNIILNTLICILIFYIFSKLS